MDRAVGLLPGIGIFADVINSGLYFTEGDLVNGLVSMGAALPVVGNAVTGSKVVVKGAKAAKTSSTVFRSFTKSGSGRVFWSGGSQARVAAESFAKSNGLKTLEMTWQGKALTRLTNATSYKLTAPLWNRASASFARGAQGSINVFHNANTGVRLNSVWRTTEYPILRGNNNIIYHNIFK